MYALIWSMDTSDLSYGRKTIRIGGEHGFPLCSYDEVMDFYLAPGVVQTGADLVIWDEVAGITMAEGWRKIEGA